MGGPTSSYDKADIALKILRTLKPHRHDNAKIHSGGVQQRPEYYLQSDQLNCEPAHLYQLILRSYISGKFISPNIKAYEMPGGLVAQVVRRSPLIAWVPSSRLGHSMWFRGGRNGVWVGFSRGFSRFPLPHISFHHFSTLISTISFRFIRPCDGASGVVGRHPCYSRTCTIGASSHLIPRPDLVLDTS